MQEFEFKMIEDETYSVTGYRGDEAEIIIPDTHGGKPVTVLFDDLFAGHPEITQVHIPETVTDIGEFVFDGCTSLKGIELPDALEHIWPYAFARSGIETIALPGKVTSIAPFTFKDCKSLKKISCGPNLKNVYAYAFGGCESLAEFYFAPGTKLSPMAFESKEMKA